MSKIFHFFDKLEDRTRERLSRKPLLYALIGAVGIVLFWRGIWHLADDFNLSSVFSIIIGTIILLITGVFVSAFIGNRLLISGLRGEKKLAEETEKEIETEEAQIERIQKTLDRVEEEVKNIENTIETR